MSRNSWSDSLPDLTGIAYRRKALAKLRLLSLSFASLLRQPKKTSVRIGIKNMKVASFFIAQPQHNQADACGNVSTSEKALSLKHALQTLKP